MNTKIDRDTWTAIIDRTFEVEFDWVGVDKLGQMAIFSSFNRGFISNKATSSFDKYQELDKLIDELPDVTSAVLYTMRNGQFKDLLSYSLKGLFAYDYQDAHREVKLGQYDLISTPKEPLLIENVKNVQSVLHILPFFDVVFECDLSFQTLEQCEKKNGM